MQGAGASALARCRGSLPRTHNASACNPVCLSSQLLMAVAQRAARERLAGGCPAPPDEGASCRCRWLNWRRRASSATLCRTTEFSRRIPNALCKRQCAAGCFCQSLGWSTLLADLTAAAEALHLTRRYCCTQQRCGERMIETSHQRFHLQTKYAVLFYPPIAAAAAQPPCAKLAPNLHRRSTTDSDSPRSNTIEPNVGNE